MPASEFGNIAVRGAPKRDHLVPASKAVKPRECVEPRPSVENHLPFREKDSFVLEEQFHRLDLEASALGNLAALARPHAGVEVKRLGGVGVAAGCRLPSGAVDAAIAGFSRRSDRAALGA